MGRRARLLAASAILAVLALAAAPVGAAVLDDGNEVSAWKIGPWDFTDDPLGAVAYAVSHLGPAMIFDAYFNPSNTPVPAGGESESVYQHYRQSAADLLASNYTNVAGIFGKTVSNESQLWPFTEAYWNSQAETSAAYRWSDFATPSPDTMISTVRDNSLVYWYNTSSVWNEFADSWSGIWNDWRDTSDIYSSMRIAYAWDGTEWNVSGTFDTEIMRLIEVGSSQQKIYLSVIPADSDYYLPGANDMYATGNGKIISADTGVSVPLHPGPNDLSALTPGWYWLGSDCTYAAQNIAGSVEDDGAIPRACMVMKNGSDWGFACKDDARYRIVRNGGAEFSSTTFKLIVAYGDASGNERISAFCPIADAHHRNLGDVVDACDKVNAAVNHAFASARTASLAAWEVFDKLQTSSYLIKPSSITAGSQTEHPLDSATASVMYVSALKQLGKLGGSASADNIRISPDSLDLRIFGDIFNKGQCIKRGAVFTPFAYDDITLAASAEGTGWNVPGMAMVWASGLGSYSAWDGKTSDPEIVTLDGCTIYAQNIFKSGTEVSSIDLEVASMEYLGLIGFHDYDPPDPPKVADLTKIVCIIAVLAGALVCVLGYATGQKWLVPVGIAAAVLMVLFAKSIASGLVGLFG